MKIVDEFVSRLESEGVNLSIENTSMVDRFVSACLSEFHEKDHPRDHGKFAEKEGGKQTEKAISFTGKQWNKAIGASDDSEIEVYKKGDNSADVQINHPEYDAQYLFRNDEDGGGKRVKIKSFYVKPEMQGKGVAAKVLLDQAKFLSDNGFKLLRLDAGRSKDDGENGYYSWPRLGFDKKLTASDKMDLPEEFQDVTTLSDLMSTDAGRKAWKEYGSTVKDLEFDLSENSRSMKVLSDYVASRKK